MEAVAIMAIALANGGNLNKLDNLCPHPASVNHYEVQLNPPSTGFVKVNCNVSFNVKSSDASVDAIIHNDEGYLIEGNAKKFKVASASFVEAFVVFDKDFYFYLYWISKGYCGV
ncbi:hypothetical protein V6N12_065185 [Hibiscus sabdariffa]|uniref:Uncharacterized protein n=1 Tax=Hibiscus sabdariffa TaxID=183260 RepID=A0ABR2G8X4_9ROSI